MTRLLLWGGVSFVWAVMSFAREVVIPVVSGDAGERIFVTTVQVTNHTTGAVTCRFRYSPTTDPSRLIESNDLIAPGKATVFEKFLSEVGAAGIVRTECSADVDIVTPIQDSTDGGRSFRDGRVYRPFPMTNLLASGSSRTVTTTVDLVIAEVTGNAVHVEVAAKKKRGATFASKVYDLPPFAQRVVDLTSVWAQFREADVEVRVTSGAGKIIVAKESDDPALQRVARHRPFERPTRVASTATGESPSITSQFLICPLKAAPFVDPATGLCFMRDRWYDPNIGTFLTPDPEEYRNSSNLYIFGKGDPVDNSDPTGRLVKFNGKDPWGDFFLVRDSIHNPKAAALMTLQGDSKRGYFLGLRSEVTKSQFLATAIPDPSTYLSDLVAQGIPLPNDHRTVEEKIFNMMSSPHITEFRTDSVVTRRSDAPFSWWPLSLRWATFQEAVAYEGGGVTLEPSDSLGGDTEIAVDPTALRRGSAWSAEAAYNLSFDPQITIIHEFGHALAYHSNNVPCFQMWSVYFENQVRARRGERSFRISEKPLAKNPMLLLCPPAGSNEGN